MVSPILGRRNFFLTSGAGLAASYSALATHRTFAEERPASESPPGDFRRYGRRAELGRAADDHRRPQGRRHRRHAAEGSAGRRRLRRPARRRDGEGAAGRLPAAERGLSGVEGPHCSAAATTRAHQGAVDQHQARGGLRLVRPGDHAGRCRRLSGRRRRLPADEEPAQRRHDSRSSARSSPAPATASSSTRPCARTSGRWASRPLSTLFPLFSGEFIERLRHREPRARRQPREQRQPRRQLRRLHLPAGLQPHARSAASTARNYNGDGISWQICHDVLVEDCHSHDHAGLGLHPGSGSQRPSCATTSSSGNDIGIFFCWGVKYGLAEENHDRRQAAVGVSIGHRDTDNLVRDNDIDEQRPGRRPLPPRARPRLRRPPQPHREEPHHQHRRRRTASASTSKAAPSPSPSAPTTSAKPAPPPAASASAWGRRRRTSRWPRTRSKGVKDRRGGYASLIVG